MCEEERAALPSGGVAHPTPASRQPVVIRAGQTVVRMFRDNAPVNIPKQN
jgi:hypothetical protein